MPFLGKMNRGKERKKRAKESHNSRGDTNADEREPFSDGASAVHTYRTPRNLYTV